MPMMSLLRWTASLLLPLSLAALAQSAAALETAEIIDETKRFERRPKGLLQVWWLPPEYWEQTARDSGWSDEQVEEVSSRIRNYIVLGVLDAIPDGAGLRYEEHSKMVERLVVERLGVAVSPLRRFDPRLTVLVPELSLPLRMSLGPLGEGVRLLFFSNVDESGTHLLDASSPGELVMRYRPADAERASEFRWRAPLTSVAGTRACPEGGEALEASWQYCPWHGVPVKPPAPPEAASP